MSDERGSSWGEAEIVIAENIQGAAVDELRSRFPTADIPDLWRDPERLAKECGSCRALLVRNQTQVTAEVIGAARNLLVIGRAGVGLDNIDMEAASGAGIVVAYAPDQNAISVAELAIGLMVSLARRIPAADQDTRSGHWNRHRFLGTELYGKTLGIVGAGRIGWLTARRAVAFGMKVLACDPFLSPDNVLLRDIPAELMDLEQILPRCDVISCHLPATSETVNLFDGARFRLVKPGALFVNTSRGQVVSEPDLIAALKDGILGGAALDVRSVEPPAAGELEGLENVILLPHLGALTREAQERVTRAICEDVARVLEGKPALNAAGARLPGRRTRA